MRHRKRKKGFPIGISHYSNRPITQYPLHQSLSGFMQTPNMPLLKQLFASPVRTGIYLLLFAATLRLLNIFFLSGSPLFAVPTSDEFEHFSLASRLATGDMLGRHEGLLWRPALFAWVCAIAFKLFGTSFLVTHALILMSDLVAVLLWFTVGLKCLSKRAAYAAGLMICLYRPFIHFSSTGYMESFAMALMGATALCLAIFFQSVEGSRTSIRNMLLLICAGLFAGLSILSRPTLMLVMPLLGVLVALKYILHRRPHAWRAALYGSLILTVATLAAISPNAIRHRVFFGKWVFLGTANEIGFHMGNNNEGWGWWVSSPGLEFDIYRSTPTALANRPLNIDSARAFWSEKNRDYVLHHTGSFLAGLSLKILQAWNRYEIHLSNDFQEHLHLSPVERFALPSGIAIPIGFAGLILWFILLPRSITSTRKSSTSLTCLLGQSMLCGWIILYMFGVALYMANTRHRLPAMPPLLLMGGYGLDKALIACRMRRHHPRILIIYVVLLVAGSALAWAPVIPSWMPIHERWWTHINKGVALRKLNRLDEAAAEFRAATATMPKKLEGWNQLAITNEILRGPAAAIPARAQLAQLVQSQYPKYTAAIAEQLDALAQLQVDAHQTTAAHTTVNRLMALSPDHFRPYLLAAKLARAEGNTSQALTFTRQALARQPHQPDVMKLQMDLTK